MIPPSQQEKFTKARLSRDPRFDGQFFVGVLSTGIFCRPICPARLPAEQNVRYFQFAQEASEQGFRPCLRCRPDSAPGSCAWLGVETSARRALQLLSNDFTATVTDIAERLGISTRYLNQLTHNAVRMSPKRYQLHSQLLQAKRLLQQTRLPVTDVAVACGFSSARRLQDNMKRWFRLTPSTLRKSNTLPSATELSLFLPVSRPYNWAQVRDFLALRAVQSIEVVDANSYARNHICQDGPASVKASYSDIAGGFNVLLSVSSPVQIQPILVTLRRVLDMDTHPDIVCQALERAGLPPHIQTQGLRLPGAWSLYEAGCRAIIGQQVSVKAAVTQLNKLVAELGAVVNEQRYFPAPETVASSQLNMLRMPAARKQALRDFAALLANSGAKPPTDQQILAIGGIGPWTLQYCKMRGHSEPDEYLSGDLIARRQAQLFAVKPDKAAPWRSYLTVQLWLLAATVQQPEK